MRAMGRIFEVRKHTMFARWNRMAKQFARIAKDITMAVKAGGSDPASNPMLRRGNPKARPAELALEPNPIRNNAAHCRRIPPPPPGLLQRPFASRGAGRG